MLLIQNVMDYKAETSPTCLSEQINMLVNFQLPAIHILDFKHFKVSAGVPTHCIANIHKYQAANKYLYVLYGILGTYSVIKCKFLSL